MADLPSNNTYNTGTNVNVPNLKEPRAFGTALSEIMSKYGMDTPGQSTGSGASSDIRSFLASRGIDMSAPSPSSYRMDRNAVRQAPYIPTSTAIGSLLPEDQRPPEDQPLPQSYIDQQLGIVDPLTGEPRPGLQSSQTPQGFGWVEPNFETTVLRTPKGIDGQYIIDRSQPGKIVKSGRAITQAEREMLLDGRPSHLFEVDHVIPLWAGGADTTANYQVLSRSEHAKKTKAQAVAYTLLANGKISESQAKFYAMTWENRDLSDVPELDEYGTMPLQAAQETKDRWDKQAFETPKVTFKDFLSAINPAGLETGQKIDKATEFLPSFLQGAVKGLVSGITGGWVRYEDGLGETGGEKAGNIVGNIGGMLIPVGLFMKGLGLAGRGVQAVGIGNRIRQAGVVGRGTMAAVDTAGNVVSSTGRAVNAVRSKSPIKYFRPTQDVHGQALAKVMAENFTKYTPAFAAYGQVQTTWEEDSSRGIRLLEDLAYGRFAAYAAPNMRGAVSAATKSGLASLVFSGMQGQDMALEDAAIMAGTVFALHGASIPGINRQAAQMSRDIFDQEMTRVAHNTYNSYLGDAVPRIAADGAVPSASPFTREQVVQLRQDARQKLFQMAYGAPEGQVTIEGPGFTMREAAPYMDMDYLTTELRKIEAAGEYLELRTLPPEERQIRELQDLYSVLQQTREGNILRADPPIMDDIVTSLPQSQLTHSYKEFDVARPTEEINAGILAGERPTGFMRTTGLAQSFHPNPEKVAFYMQAKKQGKASPTLIAVRRNDMEAHLRNISNDPAYKWTDSNPANTIQVYGITYADDGARTAVDLGFIPQSKRIDGDKYSFNSQKEIQEGKFPSYPKELNKDSIGNAMNKEGLDYLYLNFDDQNSGFLGGRGGNLKGDKTKPFVSFTLNEENWKASLAAQSGNAKTKIPATRKNLPALLSDVNNSLNTKKQQAELKAIRTKVDDPADAIFSSPIAAPLSRMSPEGTMATQGLLQNARTALMQPTQEAMEARLGQYFGIQLQPEEAQNLFMGRDSLTVRQMFDFLYKNSSESVTQLIDQTVKPFLESPTFRTQWPMGKAFPELRVLGGLKPTPEGVDMSVPTVATNAAKEATHVPQRTDVSTVAPATAAKTAETPSVAPAVPETVVTPNTVSTAPQAANNAVETVATAPIQQVLPIAERMTQAAKKMPVDITAKPRTSVEVPEAPVSAVPEAAPQGRKAITQQLTRVFTESAKDMEVRGAQLLEDVDVPGSRNQYIKRLKGIINSLDPAGQVPNNRGGSRPFSQQEKAAITKRVRDRLTVRAEELVNRAFDVNNEIAFKTGNAANDELNAAMQKVVRADTARGLGNNQMAEDIVADVPKDLLERAQELLEIRPFEDGAQKAAKPTKPTKAEYDEAVTVQTAQHKTIGTKEVDTIKQGLESDDPYTRGRSVALKEAFKKAGIDIDNPENAWMLGIPWTDTGVSKNVGTFKKGSVTDLFKTVQSSKEGQPISHTKDYLVALGEDNPQAIEEALGVRKTQIAEHQANKDMGAMGTKLDLGGKMDESDLKGGSMSLLSPIQDENMVKDMNKVWTKLYPALNASEVSGKELTAADGVRDAKAYFQFMIKEINDFMSATKKLPDGKRYSLGLMKGAGRQKDQDTFYKMSAERTKEFFKSITDTVEKALGKDGSTGDSA